MLEAKDMWNCISISYFHACSRPNMFAWLKIWKNKIEDLVLHENVTDV